MDRLVTAGRIATLVGDFPRSPAYLGLAETDEEKRGIALPRSSVVRTQSGQDLVFEHVSAERFVPRSVRIEPLDGARALIEDLKEHAGK